MSNDWKKEYCDVLSKDYKMLGDYKFGSAYCQICNGQYDTDNLCTGTFPKCASQDGPVDPDKCRMIPTPYTDGDMRVIPKDCTGRSIQTCMIDQTGDCIISNIDGEKKCVPNTEKQFEDPTQQTGAFSYPDFNTTCVSRNGEVLPYYDGYGNVTRECTFVKDLADKQVRLIPEQGYKRTNMKDCVPLSESNPTGTVIYNDPRFPHKKFKWNPKVDGGKPFCNEVTKPPMKMSSGGEIKTPFLPIRYYEDNDDGKFYIREPFQGTSSVTKVSKKQHIYWNPQRNEAFIY